jgi:hypothetical protein
MNLTECLVLGPLLPVPRFPFAKWASLAEFLAFAVSVSFESQTRKVLPCRTLAGMTAKAGAFAPVESRQSNPAANHN